MTVVAEKSSSLTNSEQLQAVEAERQGIFGLQTSTTRTWPASDLVVDTPAKAKAGKWNDA